MTLFDLEQGDKALIAKVKGRGAFRKRITEMGFIPGKEIRVVKKAPLKDPVEYSILGYNVSLRNSEAQRIEVVTEKEYLATAGSGFTYKGTFDEILLNKTIGEKGKTINVALVGNPNCGKTTLFNYASGSRERVGNYSGVTIDAKEARIRLDEYTINIVDLPGTYSFSAYSPEELFVRNFIFNQSPDVVVNVVDASNLERNLYLSTQLIDMDIRVVIALNMFDELEKSGNILDHNSLGKLLGIPVIPTIGSKGKGIDRLMRKIIEVYNDKDETVRHIHINYGKSLEESINTIQSKIKQPQNYFLTDQVSSRFLSIKMIEKDVDAKIKIQECFNSGEILSTVEKEVRKLQTDYNEDSESLVTDAKYGFIGGALKETMKPNLETKIRKSEVIDTFFTHKFWGIPVFILFMWLSFYATFKLGTYPKNWIEAGVAMISRFVEANMAEGILKDLLVHGIIAGVGGVIVFLPNILLLFLFISLMEDTGYMARAVFIMDKAMHKIGLHGKSFIPLLMGFGCNVPAIMSTRIIESRRDRMVTMLINPFMSCSARLPVYILFISAFFSNYQGTILFIIYLTGTMIAVFSALLFNRTMFRKQEVPFVMELPPYRTPTVRSLLKHMWHRGEQYVRKIAGVILIASIIIWALGYFPHHPDNKEPQIIELHQDSYIRQIGNLIQPVMQPLGFDWKMTVAVLTGVAGKEIVVGTLGVLQNDNTKGKVVNPNLVENLRSETYTSGPKAGLHVFTPLVAMSFMIFILIYFPCVAVIATIKKESGKLKWALFSIFYTTGLAWIASFLVYQVGSLIL